MAIPDTQTLTPLVGPSGLPPLENGDRLTREEFERRYEAMPDVMKAELIEGVVYVPSPVRHRHHGQPHIYLSGWLVQYQASTPGVEASDNCTVRLDLDMASSSRLASGSPGTIARPLSPPLRSKETASRRKPA